MSHDAAGIPRDQTLRQTFPADGMKMEKSSGKISASRGKYLYAIVTSGSERDYGALGINGGNVYTVCEGPVAAIVSDVPNRRIRPERRHFAAHQGVLKRLLQDGDLLPMSFGLISNGPKSIRSILTRHQETILSQLQRISGKVEMGLRVAWDVPNIFEYLVDSHTDLRTARDELLVHGQADQNQKMEVGRMFVDILESDRDKHYDAIKKVLRPSCSEIKRNKCRDEKEVANLACLVNRSTLNEFESCVFRAAGMFDDNFSFDYNGPWAPHNFVELVLEVNGNS